MLFTNNLRSDPSNRKKFALYEIAYTLVDFSAAILFTVGSILFFWGSTQNAATWCFVVGSVCFALKPTIRLVRELHLAVAGDTDDLADRYSS